MYRLRQIGKTCIRQAGKPAGAFALCAGVFGLCMVFIMPPFMVPDEATHFYRTYQLSEGHLYAQNNQGTTGGQIPAVIADTVQSLNNLAVTGSYTFGASRQALSDKIHSDETVFRPFNNTAIYSPVSYLPQLAGMLGAKLAWPSTLAMLYAGRICNLLVYIAVVVLAIRYIPFGKWALAIIALFPMAIHQAASFSSDTMVLAPSMLAVALFLRLYINRMAKLTPAHWIALAALALCLGLTKQSAALLILPFFFLPLRLFTNRIQKWWFCCILALCAFGGALAWYAAVSLQEYHMNMATFVGPGQQSEQLSFILHDPFGYVAILFRTFVYHTIAGFPHPDFYWQSLFGFFSWFTYQMPLFNILLGYGALLIALLLQVPQSVMTAITWRLKLVAAGTLAMSFMGIVTAIFVAGNLREWPVMRNLQGRYFLPILPILIPLVANRSLSLAARNSSYIGFGLLSISAFNLGVMAYLTKAFFY